MAESRDDFNDAGDSLDQVLAKYLRAQDAGARLDRDAFIARHPELGSELAGYFAAEDRLNRLVEPLHEAARAARQAALSSRASEETTQAPLASNERASPGTQFGDYELLEKLGEGGMGTVYKARHGKLNRLVALKLLRPGARASPEESARFRNEAESVAQLDHPNIQPIFDVGEYEGVPLLSMKLMEGGSLAARLADYAVDPRRAARVVAIIARAVHYAHDRGILHRDIKPSNVLMDADGSPHIADFGLAKRLGDAELTRSGTVIGTPAYMAPEQAGGRRGAVTKAADVYGLGALLYALLTGHAPFTGDDVLQVLDRLQTEEPVPPIKLNARVEPDLQLICQKCLEKDLQRRYASAELLADELERYLDGRPLVHTRAVGRAERISRWCRRNPAWASLAAVAGLSLVTIIVLGGAYMVSLRLANERERELRQRAERNRDLAVDAVDKFFTQVSESRQLQARGLERYRQSLLLQASVFYEELLATEALDPAIQSNRGRSYWRLGWIAEKLGKRAEADRLYEKARLVFQDLAGKEPAQSAYREDLARIIHQQGTLYQLAGRNKEALAAYEQALSLRRDLAREEPDVIGRQQDLCQTVFQIARQYQVSGEPTKARAKYAEILPFFEKRLREMPNDPASHDLLAKVLLNQGDLALAGNPKQAIELFRHAAALEETALTSQPDNADIQDTLAQSLHHLGRAYFDAKQLDPARPAYHRAAALREQLAQKHPDVPDYLLKLATVLHGQARLDMQQKGTRPQAISAFERALAMGRRVAELFAGDPLAERQLAAATYDAACCYALCCGSAEANSNLKEAERRELSERYARRAVDLLTQLGSSGLAAISLTPKQVKTDTDLAALLGRADFQGLVNGWQSTVSGKATTR
jgi:tetratricopeptide (TPR) repeat protein/tRNA A-37 threonylcarbamoyl transferase component Bud32